MQPVVTDCCARAGKAGGAIALALNFLCSFLFQDKKE
jgi:hypothetical protein